MRKFAFATALAAASLTMVAMPAQAKTETFSAKRVIDHFNYDILVAVAKEMGATVETGSTGDWLVRFSNGTAATVNFTVCKDDSQQSCLGTNIAGRYAKPTDMSDDEIKALVVDFNRRWSAGKSFLTDDGRPVVQAYVIVDGGITMENYRQQLYVYSQMLSKMRDLLYGE